MSHDGAKRRALSALRVAAVRIQKPRQKSAAAKRQVQRHVRTFLWVSLKFWNAPRTQAHHTELGIEALI